MNEYYLCIYFLISYIFFDQSYIHAQEPTIWYNRDHTTWPSALSGGFIAPQFSTFDLNQDGNQEMITFDRFSGIIQVWSPVGDKLTYESQMDFPVEWPEIRSWMLIRDFNQDHIPDIFTQGSHGIAVYKGIKDGQTVRFEKMTGASFIDDSLKFQHKSGSSTNIYHGAADIPIIEDIDGDGDLDILTFELSGSYLYHYENRWDKTGKELDFILRHNCWGYFAENQFSDEINISNNELACPPPFSVRHAGSTSCLIDVNHDSLPDLILGDIGTKSLKVLINKGSQDTGIITQVNPAFPNQDAPATLHYFPAAYKIDVDQDSINDVVIAVNDYPLTDQEGIWFYKGTGNPDEPFLLHSDHWLKEQYIDLGTYSSPLFIDVNGDGHKDLLVGYQETLSANKPLNKIAYFEGLNDREYQLKDLDFGTLSKELLSGYRPYLTAGDVDGDGDEDLLVGMSNGTSYLIYNGSGTPRKFQVEKIEKNWGGLQMLSGATPELFDIDGDGDLDIVAGTDNGTIGLYINTGNKFKAVFNNNLNHPPNINQFGQIHTVDENILLGRSAPRIIINDSDTILVSGSFGGKIFAYRINSEDLSSKFTRINLKNWPQWGGSNGRLTINQNEEKVSRFLIGNIAGGLTEKAIPLVSTSRDSEFDLSISLFPNPLTPGEKLNLTLAAPYQIKKINLYFTNGKLHHSYAGVLNHQQISTADWLPGIYFLQITLQNNRSIVRKVIVQ